MKVKGKTNRTHIHYITVVLVLLCTTCLDPFPLPDVSIGYSGGPIEPIAGLISLGWNGFAAEHRLVERGQPAPILGDDVYVCEASGHV